MTKLAYLDGIRAIAALFVFFSHAYLLQCGWVPTKTPADVLLYPRLAVDVFITLSGFCLGYSAIGMKLDYRRFMARRCLRILPAYYGAMLVSGLFYLAYIGYGQTIRPIAVLTTALMLNDVYLSDAHFFSPTFWTIGIEWRLYLCFPTFLCVYRQRGWLLVLTLSGFVAVVCFLVASTLKPDFPSHWQQRGSVLPLLFACGLIASKQLGKPVRVKAWLLGSGICLAIVLLNNLITLEDGNRHHITALPLIEILMGIFSAVFLMGFGNMALQGRSHWALRLMSCKPLIQAAPWSYSLYLLHYPLLQAANRWLAEGGVYQWQAIALEILPVLLCCYLFSLVFERPYLRQRQP